MDAATVNQLQDEYDTRDKYGEKVSKWGYEQDAYLLIYPVLYQNIPSLSIMNATGENEFISSSRVYFIYGRNGLIAFEVSGVFDVKSTIQDSYICSTLDVVQSIKKSFENIILDNEIEITMIKLGYIARYDFDNFTEWRIEPVWFIDGKYGKCKNSLSDIIDIKENLEGQNYTAIISAVSGEAIPLVSIGG
jgi:regulatory protein YycI of two-component signal transduction system YycFG